MKYSRYAKRLENDEGNFVRIFSLDNPKMARIITKIVKNLQSSNNQRTRATVELLKDALDDGRLWWASLRFELSRSVHWLCEGSALREAKTLIQQIASTTQRIKRRTESCLAIWCDSEQKTNWKWNCFDSKFTNSFIPKWETNKHRSSQWVHFCSEIFMSEDERERERQMKWNEWRELREGIFNYPPSSSFHFISPTRDHSTLHFIVFCVLSIVTESCWISSEMKTMMMLVTSLICVVVGLVVTLSGTFTTNTVRAQTTCPNCTRMFFCVLGCRNVFRLKHVSILFVGWNVWFHWMNQFSFDLFFCSEFATCFTNDSCSIFCCGTICSREVINCTALESNEQ